jgi:hypothetical protein
MSRITRLLVTLAAVLTLATAASAEVIYVAGSNNTLISFNSATPSTTLASRPITGLADGDQIVGIDFRPASGGLVALASSSRLYRINVSSGAATVVGSSAFTPSLAGTQFGFDFNPTVDRARVVSSTQQNLRLSPDSGAVAATDANLSYAPGDVAAGTAPAIAEIAYTNSVASATSTTLYGIDSGRDTLVRIGSLSGTPASPNAGLVYTVGALGVDTNAAVGFDISSATGVAYAALQNGSTSDLYTIDLSTGAATRIGTIGGTSTVHGLAVAQDLVRYTLPIVGSAAGANGSFFRTEVTLTNSAPLASFVRVEYFASTAPADAFEATAAFEITLEAGQQKVYGDLLQSELGLQGTGALRISASRPIGVMARIYNDLRTTGKGTLGQLVRGVEDSGRTSGLLPGLSNVSAPDGLRANIGFFNPNVTTVSVTFTAKDASGATLDTASRDLSPLSQTQLALSQLFPALPATTGIYVTYTTIGGPIHAYGSLIDNTSGDPTFIPAFAN